MKTKATEAFAVYHQGPLLLTWFNFVPAWISIYIDKVWDEITYPFPHFNCGAVDVWDE